VRVILPEPPSLNAMTATDFRTRRRFKTKAYSDWRAEAVRALGDCPPLGKGPFRVVLELPAKCRKDIDNCNKPVLDALQVAGVIDDDRHVHDLRVYKGKGTQTILTVEVM